MSISNLATQIATKIAAKIAANPDPTKILAADLDAILTAFLAEMQVLLGTGADSFFIGSPDGQDQEGSRTLVFQENATGPKMAIRYYFDTSTTPATRKLQYTNNYTGGSDVWEDLDLSNVARLDVSNVFTQAIQIHSPYTSSGNALWFKQSGDTHPRFVLNTDGYMYLGPGNTTTDTFLFRESFGKLKTLGKFNAADGLQNKGADLIAYKTGTHVDFRAMTTHFGSLAAAETGNYTADLTGAVIGHVAVSFHNAGTEPTFTTSGVTFNKIGTKAYVLGATNRILFHYVGSSTIDYMIQ